VLFLPHGRGNIPAFTSAATMPLTGVSFQPMILMRISLSLAGTEQRRTGSCDESRPQEAEEAEIDDVVVETRSI